ncbi:MAG: hypothetical protein V2J55_16680 [Candidatus Competibacteraceae bacterium]|jgi:hypothetical protein|nr:hypothetical protein [Candidatus Competibacteraceae bacterium]
MMLRKKPLSGLLLGALACGSPSYAADPCPWQGEEYQDACARWDGIQQSLEEATRQAEEAAQKLQSMAPADPTVSATTPEEVRVKAIIDRILSYFTKPVAEMGGFDIDADYVLTQENGAFTTQFAKAAWVATPVRADFGPLTFRIEPGDKGFSKVAIRIGDVITVRNGEKILSRVLISQQSNHGAWDDALESFGQFDSSFGQINVVVPGEAAIVSIDAVTLGHQLSRDAADNWQAKQQMALQDLQFQGEGQTLSLARITAEGEAAGQNYQKLMKFTQEMNALSQTENLDDSEAAKKVMGLLNDMYGSISRFDTEMTLNTLAIGSVQEPDFKLGQVALSANFAAADDGSTFGYAMGFSNLATQIPGVPANITPTDARFEMGLTDIPPQLFSRFMEIAIAADQLPEAEQEAYMNQHIPALFLGSKLGAYIKDTFIAAPDTRVDLDVTTQVDPEAAMGGAGEMLLRITGIDKVLEAAQTMPPEQQTFMPVLGMMLTMSNRAEEDGKVIDTYDLKLTKEGKLWLNGKDVTSMFLASTGAGSSPPQQEPTPEQPAAKPE